MASDPVGFNPAVDAAIQRKKAELTTAQQAGGLVGKKETPREKTAAERSAELHNVTDHVQLGPPMEDAGEDLAEMQDNIVASFVTGMADDAVDTKEKTRLAGRRDDEDLPEDETAQQRRVTAGAQVASSRPEETAHQKIEEVDLTTVRKGIDFDLLQRQTGASPEGIQAAFKTVETQLPVLGEDAERLRLKPADGRGDLKPNRLAPIGGALSGLAGIEERWSGPIFMEP